MCTVTFLPVDSFQFILTSNRDESPDRKRAIAPQEYYNNNQKIIFPKDGEAGGTWIATSETHFTLCLLNGAFEFHHHHPPYKLSRGLMLLDFFKFSAAGDFEKKYDFSGIEPFTLLIIDHNKEIKITEIRWDENEKLFISNKDPLTPHIWSSATLYSKQTIMEREKWFGQWLENNKNYEIEDILRFHHFGGDGNIYNDIMMKREKVKTISVTSVNNKNGNIEMIYEDLLFNQTKVIAR